MQTLLTLCEETCKILQSQKIEEPISILLNKNLTLKKYARWIEEQLQGGWEIYRPSKTISESEISPPTPLPRERGENFPLYRIDENRKRVPKTKSFKAITWNLERGKYFDSILKTLKTHPDLKEADFYFFTEVDWGMARSANRNVAAELARELDYHAYFSPSYFNFTKGHGAERHLPGENLYGLHGKAILSRYPLKNFRAVKMSNTIDKLTGKEARLGEKRALLADLFCDENKLTLACTHLDVFSSPRLRADQLQKAIVACHKHDQVLIGGDWNTNTLDFLSHRTIISTVAKQIIFTGPQKMIRNHYSFPERKFDRPIFEMLKNFNFNYENCNELGVGTFDLLSSDEEVGLMGKDRFPEWIVRWIGRQIQKSGGSLSFKLDWFAAKNLEILEKRVIRLKKEVDYLDQRPSDHHPILLKFNIPTLSTADRSIQNNAQSREESFSESVL